MFSFQSLIDHRLTVQLEEVLTFLFAVPTQVTECARLLVQLMEAITLRSTYLTSNTDIYFRES